MSDISREPDPGTTGGSTSTGRKSTTSKIKAEAKAQGGEFAQDMKHQAGDFADEQKERGARQIDNFAKAIDRAADELEHSSPYAAKYAREAAHSVDGMSRTLRDRGIGDLIGGVDNFARRQPLAFFGAAVAVGIGLSRFLKSTRPLPDDDLYEGEEGYHRSASRERWPEDPETTSSDAGKTAGKSDDIQSQGAGI
ncbi:hypothetical protein [Inquilinus sp. CAU 1745]|uniref:hypothetical protein n=1 Tax=Inquilinus sp. CAU 1745 TaxID=3140369 RepID=UPI00325A7E4C